MSLFFYLALFCRHESEETSLSDTQALNTQVHHSRIHIHEREL